MRVRRLSAYLILLYLGCVMGIYLGSRAAEAAGLPPYRFAFASIALAAIGLVGARTLHRWRTGQRGDGGAAVYGGLLAIVPTSIPVLAIADLRFWSYWEAASVSMLFGLIITKFGCLMNGCCAGRETRGLLGIVSSNARGELRRRYPAQLLEAAWAAAILGFALWIVPEGHRFATALAGYGAGRLWLERIRESEPGKLAWTNSAISAGLVLAGIAIYAFGSDAW